MDRIKAALAAILAEDNFGTMTTDKGIIKWEGEENLKEGDTVVMVDEDGNDKSIEDGEYVTDEVKITVENGSVKSIEEIKKEDETPEETVEETAEETTTAFTAKKSAYEASYSEKERKIMDAIIAAGYKDAWIVDAGDDFAVVELYHEVDGVWVDEYLRFDIEWDGEDAKVVGEPTKVRNAFVPEDTNTEEMFEAEASGETTEEVVEETNEEGTVTEDTDKLEERLKAIEERLDKIEEALKNVETAPVEEQYEVANKETATSRKEKRLNEIFGRC